MSIVTLSSDLGFKGFKPPQDEQGDVHVRPRGNTLVPKIPSEYDRDGKTPTGYSIGTTLPDRGSIFVEGGQADDPNIEGRPQERAINQGFKLSLEPNQTGLFTSPDPYSQIASSKGTTRGSNFVTGDDANAFEGTFPTTYRPRPGEINQAVNTGLQLKEESNTNLANQNKYGPNNTFRTAIADRQVENAFDDFLNPNLTPPVNATFRNLGNLNLKGLKHYEGNGLGTIGTPLIQRNELPDNDADPYEYKSLSYQGRARRDDVTRLSRLLISNDGSREPAGNRFQANLAIIATQKGINAGQKAAAAAAEGNLGAGLKAGLKAAGGSLLDSVKVVSGIIAQTPVTGTGTHFIYAPAVNNQYLQKSESKGLLNTLGAATGIGAGSGINGANEAYLKGKVSLPAKGIELPEGSTAQPISLRAKFFSETKDGTSLDITSFETLTLADLDTKDNGSRTEDIIPFNFTVFSPDNPGKVYYIRLRAFLESLSDDYTGEWNATKYIGRGEDLYNYTGFNREVTFNFKIAALSKLELVPLYNKLNKLVASTAPSYDENKFFMRGTFVKVTIGDYLRNIPGFFRSISLNWNSSYPWEINATGTEQITLGSGGGSKLYTTIAVPTVLDVSMTFHPVHDFNPTNNASYISRKSLSEKSAELV